MKIKTIEIELAIAKYFGIRTNIIVPNLSWGLAGMHECDLFILRKSGYAVEVEIKISKSDLLADFDKKHSHIDIKNRICEFYYALPVDLYEKCGNLVPNNAGILVCERLNSGKILVRLKRKAKRISNARKLTSTEQLKVATLGCIRIWTLKEKLIKNVREN